MFRYKNINSFDFKQIISRRVKRFNWAFKTFVNCFKALISVVASFNKALTFSRGSLLIPKRLRIYFVANDYNKSVQTIYLIALTYTINYCNYIDGNVKGEIRKKALLNKSKCLNNELALKLRRFFMITPCG
jgi:hypothetical protein